eukprot:7691901-Pyramimonas_sp.AAC.1
MEDRRRKMLHHRGGYPEHARRTRPHAWRMISKWGSRARLRSILRPHEPYASNARADSLAGGGR